MLAGEAEKDELPALKRNLYAEAADPGRYRAVDAILFACAQHAKACVLCTTAGKNGRNGRTAAVGATLFWLACPYLNALIARLEGHRCVQTVTEAMKRHPKLTEAHVQSHEAYAARARRLLTDAQWTFFETHFIACTNAPLRKFGNAAVSHADDMKCLHALAAQTLAGAANPVGSLVINYVLFLHQLTCAAEDEVALQEERRVVLRAALDSAELFACFVEAVVVCIISKTNHLTDEESGREVEGQILTVPLPHPRGFGAAEVTYSWHTDATFSALSPDVCARALRVLVFLEGKPPRLHKKHRIN